MPVEEGAVTFPEHICNSDISYVFKVELDTQRLMVVSRYPRRTYTSVHLGDKFPLGYCLW